MTEKIENTNTVSDASAEEVKENAQTETSKESYDLTDEIAALKKDIERLTQITKEKEKAEEEKKKQEEVVYLRNQVQELSKKLFVDAELTQETTLDGTINVSTSATTTSLTFDLFNEETNKHYNKLVDQFLKNYTNN